MHPLKKLILERMNGQNYKNFGILCWEAEMNGGACNALDRMGLKHFDVAVIGLVTDAEFLDIKGIGRSTVREYRRAYQYYERRYFSA